MGIDKHEKVKLWFEADLNNKWIYERKGNLQIKEEGEEKLSKRVFVLLDQTLYYFKEKLSKTEIWLIPLLHAWLKKL